MSIKSFFSNWIVKNLLLALVFVAVFVILANVLLNVITQHGKEIAVPDFTSMTVQEAARVASSAGVEVVVSDSMYIRRLKPGTVYKQNPGAVAPGSFLVNYTCSMNLRNCSLPSAVRLYTPACSSTLANTRPVSYWTMSQALSLVMDSYLVLKPSAQSACLAVVS